MTGKRPRHYASAYLAARTPEAQKRAVAGCPPEWHDLVRSHVRIMRESKIIDNNC